MSTKEVQDAIYKNMEAWKKIENASVASTGQVIEKTTNPVIRLVMEIIQHDSQMHYRVQEFIQRSLKEKAVSMTPDELEKVWKLVENHIKIEEKTMKMAKASLEALKKRKMVVCEYLIHYLLKDEKKHNDLLAEMATIKKGMYPYG
ncbi:MAG: hypothetical protein KBA15_14170 [Spirochaetes bacterium]|jgi:hypothetical protein|nr:hypothetical protein [Spirochaetota bacterium]